jgi:perosamine synthetase
MNQQLNRRDFIAATAAAGLFQNMLLGTRSDMDQIAEAVRKIRANAAALAKA